MHCGGAEVSTGSKQFIFFFWTSAKNSSENSPDWNLEASMQHYEIRFLRTDQCTDTVIEVMHLSDHAAIRAAKKIAEARPFEVWRDLDCIYGGAIGSGPPPASPRPEA